MFKYLKPDPINSITSQNIAVASQCNWWWSVTKIPIIAPRRATASNKSYQDNISRHIKDIIGKENVFMIAIDIQLG